MFYVIPDTLWYNVEHGDQFYWCLTTLSTMCLVQRMTCWPVLLVFNDTFNNVSGITYNMVTSFIGV
jgi:hypothetical protein